MTYYRLVNARTAHEKQFLTQWYSPIIRERQQQGLIGG